MNWDAAEAAIKSHIETNWAAGAHAAIPLVFENENASYGTSYMLVNIEGIFAEKGIYGSVGKRSSVEGGIVFFHCYVAAGSGKAAATAPVRALTQMLELQVISSVIDMDGGNPPSPADQGDPMVPADQPGGNYFRCSGSVPFIVRSAI